MCSHQVRSWIGELNALPEPDPRLGGPLADDVVALRELVERAQVAYLARLAALDAATSGSVAGETIAGFIAGEVRLPRRVVVREVTVARSLHTDTDRACPATRVLLAEGQLTVPQAEVISRTLRGLLPADVEVLEPTIAAACAQLDPSATDRICSHARLIAGDVNAERREERDHAARSLHVSPCGSMVRLDGMLPAAEGATVIAALDALAQPTADELGVGQRARSRPQRMADALVELASRQLASAGMPAVGGSRPGLHLTISLPDLLARAGAARVEGRSTGAATWNVARRVGCDAALDWSVTETAVPQPHSGADAGTGPGGLLDPAMLARLIAQIAPALGGSSPDILAAGRTIRLVSPAIRKALARRDRGCAYPGCDRPPDACDAHHLVHWADGGPTDLENLALVCPFHHTRLHIAGETLQRDGPGYHRVDA